MWKNLVGIEAYKWFGTRSHDRKYGMEQDTVHIEFSSLSFVFQSKECFRF